MGFKNQGNTRSTITIVLADDHALLRETVRTLLDTEVGFSVLGVAGCAEDAVGLCLKLHPQVLLLDIDMPGSSSFDSARLVKQQVPATRVIFLTAHCHDLYIEQALAANVSGYVTKSEPPERLIEAIRTVASGGTFYSAEVRARLALDHDGHAVIGQGHLIATTLTPRETEVLRHIAKGMSKKEIAKTIHIGVKTVEHHTFNLMSKLDIHDRVKLALYAVREGLVES